MTRPPCSTLFPYTTLSDLLPPTRQEDALMGGYRDDLREQAKDAMSEAAAVARDSLAPESRGHARSEEHTSELQSRENLVCRLLLEKKKKKRQKDMSGLRQR